MKKILEVPQVKQEQTDYHGLAALSMVLAFYKVDVSQKQLATNFILNGKGSYDKELLKCATGQGFFAQPHKKASLDTIVTLVKRGIPPIVKTRKGDRDSHYCVVKGFDLENKVIYFNDPSDLRRTKLKVENFEKAWSVENNKRGYKNYLVSIRPKRKK